MKVEDVRQAINSAFEHGTAHFADGFSVQEITNERGERAYALVLWERGREHPDGLISPRDFASSVYVFTVGGFAEFAEFAAEVVKDGESR